MALSPGTRLGAYEILSALGAGGMGEVYRATDTVLKRQVALKILPPDVANDPERVARFQREAEVLASLNHPNIAHLYGLERSGGTLALVMELVEGPTLADRIAQGAIPLDEALPIAKQIAEALEAAHEQGIIHRDLKPANIKVRDDGTVKVLDFGLAKAMEPTSGVRSNLSGMTNSPTITSPALMTGVGILLGTAAYMSPEQAKGRAADKRSDVWAFGCVLYEMLTSRRAFEGEDVSDTLAGVLRGAPNWDLLPAATPRPIVTLLRGCLEKDRNERVSDIAVARFAIRGALKAPGDDSALTAIIQAAGASRRPPWSRALPVAAAAVIAATIVGVTVWLLRPTSSLAVTRFTMVLGEGQTISTFNNSSLAISPDGTQLIYVANNQLYLRAMSALEAKPIPGTQQTPGPTTPVFAPDSRSVAFYSQADRSIKRIGLGGGAAVSICPAELPFLGMSWTAHSLLFGQMDRGILRVSENGGQPETVAAAKLPELVYGPQVLPGGEWVLFATLRAENGTTVDWDKATIVAQSLKSAERRTLVSGGSEARYIPSGYLVYALSGVAFAAPFDLRRTAVTGGAVSVVEGVRRSLNASTGVAHFGISETGTLVFRPGPVSSLAGQYTLGLIDRTGGIQSLNLPAGAYEHPRLSPDAKRIVFGSDDGQDATVWIYDLSGTSQMRRLTLGGRNRIPIWVDNDHVAFQSDREGDLGIFWQRTDGTTPAERLTKPDRKDVAHLPESMSRDGKTLLFAVSTGPIQFANTTYSLAMLSLADRKVSPFPGTESIYPPAATFSPDGKWIAYTVASAGAISGGMVFAQPFPPTGATYPVSKAVGIHPVWSPDGKELIYSPAPGAQVSVSVATVPTFALGNPVRMPQPFVERGPGTERPVDFMADGKHFLGVVPIGSNAPTDPSAAQEIQVVLNWSEELKRLVQAKP
jgi:serine/threonine-protein kinase